MIAQSATSITDFKLCPMLYRFRHVLRLRPIETPDSAQMGTNWHKCLEILTMVPGEECPECIDPQGGDGPCPDCWVCNGVETVPADTREALICYLTQVYATCPPSKELTDWEVERTVLLYSALGWAWYWHDDKIETLAREVHFNRQINSQYSRRGKIDRIVRYKGQLAIGEYKSTTKPIDPGSLYWDRLKLDSQITLYLIEARHAQIMGELGRNLAPGDPLISGMLYDVWHKPTIRPKKLSQADSKKFVSDGKQGAYYGEKFDMNGSVLDPTTLTINGVLAEVTPGAEPKSTKKNPNPQRPFAIRETPEMFGARLLADIRENPEKHFARKEISRTDAELAKANEEYYNLARLADMATKRNLWYRNENNCDATWRCPFHTICYYDIDVEDGQVPDGFRCLNKDKK